VEECRVFSGEDLDCLRRLRIPQVEAGEPSPEQAIAPGRVDKGVVSHYLRGPIDLAWLGRACALPGKALATALAIWWLRGMRKQSVGLCLTSQALKKFAVMNPWAKMRALDALEKAELIRVERQSGKNPLVSILEAPDEGGSQQADG
jgi:hypothetical protein